MKRKDSPRDEYGHQPPVDTSAQRAALEAILARHKAARAAKLREIAEPVSTVETSPKAERLPTSQESESAQPAEDPESPESPEQEQEQEQEHEQEETPADLFLPDGTLKPEYIRVETPLYQRGEGNDAPFWIGTGYLVTYRLRRVEDGDATVVYQDAKLHKKSKSTEPGERQTEWRQRVRKEGTRDPDHEPSYGYSREGFKKNGYTAPPEADRSTSFTERIGRFGGWGR